MSERGPHKKRKEADKPQPEIDSSTTPRPGDPPPESTFPAEPPRGSASGVRIAAVLLAIVLLLGLLAWFFR